MQFSMRTPEVLM